MPGRSRPGRRRARTAWRSTTSSFGSRRSSASRRGTSAGPPSGRIASLRCVPPPDRSTKIVATIGPASNDEVKLAALVDAGMDAVRLNFSHGAHSQHELSARRARAAQHEAGRPLALIADLQGPKIRVGDLEKPVDLQVGESIVVAGEEECGSDDLPVAPAVLASVLEANDEVLIDD